MKSLPALVTVVLVVATVWILGARYQRFWTSSPVPVPKLLTERLSLAGEFSGPLPLGLERSLKSLALELESEPRRLEIMQGRSVDPERVPTLSYGFQLWSRYLKAPNPDLRSQLNLAAYEGLLRLLKVFAGLLVLLSFGVGAAWWGKTSASAELQPGKTSLTLITGVFCAWIVLPHLLGRLNSVLWPALDPFAGLMLAQMWSYLVAGFLLAGFWRWKAWRPWRAVDWRLVGHCYLALLAILPLGEVLIHRLTGLAPEVILSLAPVFQGRTLAEATLLTLIAILVGPLVEELMFRGWLLLGLAQQGRKPVALFVSSLLFGLCHGNLWGLPIYFAFGLVTGWMTLRTGTPASSLALHVLWNATTLLLVAAVV